MHTENLDIKELTNKQDVKLLDICVVFCITGEEKEMARIRYLKPDFFKDEDLAEHPYWIRLLFQGLWTIADKEGRLEDRIKRIKVDVFPYDNVDIEKGLLELSKIKNHSNRPFIQRYEVSGEKYIQIINWKKHQKPHHTEKDSIIPIPPLLNTKGMEKGMGMEKQDEASSELRNGEITVKTPLSAQIDFIQTLKANPAYKHINIENELAKMDAWLLVNKGRQKTQRFIVNWLNKVDKVIPAQRSQSQVRKDPKPRADCEVCGGTGKIKERNGAQCFCVT